MGLSEQDVATIADRCRDLPAAQGVYVQRDYITNLFLAVLDYRSTAEGVRKALGTYRDRLWNTIRTLEDLKQFLAKYPDTPDGNMAAGSHLWGFKAARRVGELRGLVKFFEKRGVVNQELLSHWARSSHYRDFMGRVRGLGLDIYDAMLIRQGYGQVKPAPHLATFLSAALGHPVPDGELTEAVERASEKLAISARELDRRIYEHEVGSPRG